MNLSEVFIRRPIATSLLMVGDRAVRRHRVPRAAGQRSAAGRLPDAQRQRRPARRRSGHDGVVGRQPARAAVHDDRRPRLDDLVAAARAAPTSRCSSISNRDIDSADRRRADGDRRGDAAAAGRACRRRRRSARTTRPTSRSCMLNLTSNTLPLSALDDYAETMIAPRISMVSGVSQVQVQGAPKYAVRVQVDPDKLHAAAASASTKSTRRCRTGTSTCRPASCSARTPTYNIKATGQLMNADAFRPIDRHLPQRRAGPARPGRQRHRQRRERLRTRSWFYTKDDGSRARARSPCR